MGVISIYIVLAYLLGSIPTAVWVGKSWYKIDVREHGSKNSGATNTFRVLGKKPGIVVLLIDVIKGVLAVTFPYFLDFASWGSDELIQLQLILGILAVIGHIFPVFAGFNGGKGVATSLGIVIGIHPFAALVCLGVFLIVFILSSYVSLGAILAAVTFPFSVHFLFQNQNFYLLLFSILLSLAVILAHKANIQRIVNGEENKMRLFGK